MENPSPELMVVMPVFNEQVAVESVVHEWIGALESEVPRFTLLAINDGSNDGTQQILTELQDEYPDRLEVLSRPNRGHGKTCMEGYQIALQRQIPYVFQIDSDGQSDPKHFHQFWRVRQDYDVIYGKRLRGDGFRRMLASLVLRAALRVFAGVDCVDANVPYRLMNIRSCANSLRSVPPGLSLANVGLAVLLKKDSAIRHGEIPIHFPPRRGGEPSVPFTKFAAKAFELFSQMKKGGII